VAVTAVLARLVGLVGGLAGIVCIAALVAMPELPGLRTLGLTAAAGLGGWIYLDWPALARFGASRGGLEAARALLLVAVCAVIAAVSVALALRAGPRWDLTPEGSHSVTPRTAAALAGLEGDPIGVRGFFVASGDPLHLRHRARWDALAAAFAAAGPSLQVETLDPQVSRRRAEAAGVTSNGVVLVTRGERTERIYAPDEASLLNAILRVARDRSSTVYVTTGHGERRIDEVDAGSLTELRRELVALGLGVEPLDLSRTPIPDDATVLLVLDPTLPFAPRDADRIQAWLGPGRALLVAGEPGRTAGLDELLAAGGLALGPGVIVDPLVRSVTGDASTPMVARYGSHASVRGLRTPAVFLGASPVIEVPNDPMGVTVYALAASSELAWAERDPGKDPLDQGPQDLAGPVTLLALAELHEGGKDGGIVALSGDADWMTNQGLESPGNRDLAVRLVGALARQQDLVVLPERALPKGSLALDWATQVMLALLALVLVPGGCFAVGGALWLRRRTL
jgi:hypothetical protein